jgi:hypothetical protein
MTDQIEFSGDGDDRDDLSPGDAESQLFDDVDESHDYEAATETWIGEPATTELSIETVDGIDVKQFVLREPDEQGSMRRIFRGIMEDDRRAVCEEIVDAPTLTDDIWQNRMVERERELLYDHVLAWIRVQDFVDMQAMLESSDASNW